MRGLDHFTIDMTRLEAAADLVAAVTRECLSGPRRAVPCPLAPYRDRRDHDRWGAIAEAMDTDDPRRYGRAAFDLAIVSVLVDAGAGANWRYQEAATGETFSRSEGLAVASVDMFRSGLFLRCARSTRSGPMRPRSPLSAQEELGSGFPGRSAKPDRRAGGAYFPAQPARGETVASRPDLFALEDDPRPGGLFDAIVAEAETSRMVAAPRMLELVLDGLGAIWPGRITLGGVNLGDTWHPRGTGDR